MSKLIEISHKGNFQKVERFFKRMLKPNVWKILDKYGRYGVEALTAATPVDTGLTAASWSYEIQEADGSYSIIWKNSNNTRDGVPIVILLQYGHGTRCGTYVKGIDFINPALKPVFDSIADILWREVTQ